MQRKRRSDHRGKKVGGRTGKRDEQLASVGKALCAPGEELRAERAQAQSLDRNAQQPKQEQMPAFVQHGGKQHGHNDLQRGDESSDRKDQPEAHRNAHTAFRKQDSRPDSNTPPRHELQSGDARRLRFRSARHARSSLPASPALPMGPSPRCSGHRAWKSRPRG